MSISSTVRFALLTFVSASLVLSSCKKKEDETPDPVTEEETTPHYRNQSINYNDLTSTTPYNNDLFEDAEGDSTIDRYEGQKLLRMINALSAEARKGTSQVVSATVLSNMFFNTGSPFSGGNSDLNSSALSLYNITATSKAGSLRDDVISDFNTYFTKLSAASASYASAATSSQAGVMSYLSPSTGSTSKYLVDSNGIEYLQVIQKSMMGTTQYDYIGNYLLDEGLDANNTQLVSGKNYTALEHNWDMAYGLYTVNNVLYNGYNNTDAGTPREALIAAYVWEYNKAAYSQMQLAFLKGRAAIINGDMATLKTQANFIRRAMEQALAAAGVGYLKKWLDNTTDTDNEDAYRAHAIGEGAGFIYSTRFCYLNGGNEAFSDAQLTTLGLYAGDGFWDLSAPNVTTASNAIKTKFNLVP